MEETQAYIAQRLGFAGWNGEQIFDPSSLTVIHQYSSGIPRVVNLICEHCLVNAFIDEKKTITPEMVRAVIRDHELDDFPVAREA